MTRSLRFTLWSPSTYEGVSDCVDAVLGSSGGGHRFVLWEGVSVIYPESEAQSGDVPGRCGERDGKDTNRVEGKKMRNR